jgi:hypothetical protein
MALPENQYGIDQLVEQLAPRIVGKPRPGHACGCGDSRCATPAVADEIMPSGEDRPGMEVMWATWRVRMMHPQGGRIGFHPLDYFVDTEEVRAMFNAYFGDQKYSPALAS